jgi:endoribonuclease Dicer
MVANSILATICVHAGLHKYILHNSNALRDSIDTYASDITVRRDAEYAAAAEQGRVPKQYWLELEPPKVTLPFESQMSLD